ncbi:hypothetical protein QBC38DRAFT_459553 [Podospora fimiseda]|uniref:Protein kinase domain-containing protein n=1 Tax=Podospora fimiseda TaxID=252190 RepID=A0AAN7GUB2_9PEZI|nr:hypothetical protein QBC38DRAFT_459553 [Podospora fimiseda]
MGELPAELLMKHPRSSVSKDQASARKKRKPLPSSPPEKTPALKRPRRPGASAAGAAARRAQVGGRGRTVIGKGGLPTRKKQPSILAKVGQAGDGTGRGAGQGRKLPLFDMPANYPADAFLGAARPKPPRRMSRAVHIDMWGQIQQDAQAAAQAQVPPGMAIPPGLARGGATIPGIGLDVPMGIPSVVPPAAFVPSTGGNGVPLQIAGTPMMKTETGNFLHLEPVEPARPKCGPADHIMVMEYLEYNSLAHLLWTVHQRQMKIPSRTLWLIFIEVIRTNTNKKWPEKMPFAGLLPEDGGTELCHFDIDPSNIFVDGLKIGPPTTTTLWYQ